MIKSIAVTFVVTRLLFNLPIILLALRRIYLDTVNSLLPIKIDSWLLKLFKW